MDVLIRKVVEDYQGKPPESILKLIQECQVAASTFAQIKEMLLISDRIDRQSSEIQKNYFDKLRVTETLSKENEALKKQIESKEKLIVSLIGNKQSAQVVVHKSVQVDHKKLDLRTKVSEQSASLKSREPSREALIKKNQIAYQPSNLRRFKKQLNLV